MKESEVEKIIKENEKLKDKVKKLEIALISAEKIEREIKILIHREIEKNSQSRI